MKHSKTKNKDQLQVCEVLESRTLLAAGDLDQGFGLHGAVTTNVEPGTAYERAQAVVIDRFSTNAIYLAGTSGGTYYYGGDMSAVRYIDDDASNQGSLDPTFGSGGRSIIDVQSSSPDEVYCSVQDSFGNLLIAGDVEVASSGGGYDRVLAIARLKYDGGRDTSFGTNGVAMFRYKGSTATAIIPLSNGKFLVDATGIVTRFNSDGSIDEAFGTNGSTAAITNFDGGFNPIDGPFAMAVQPDGSFYQLGYYSGGVQSGKLGIVHYSVSGIVDTSYGNGGTSFLSVSGYGALLPRAIQLTADGKLLVLAQAEQGSGGSGYYYSASNTLLARLTTAGSLDPAFGAAGIVTNRPSSQHLLVDPRSINIQADGKIVVAGTTVLDISPYTSNAMVVRFSKDGQIDNSFAQTGLAIYDLAAAGLTSTSITSSAIRGNSLYIGGSGTVSGGGGTHYVVAAVDLGALQTAAPTKPLMDPSMDTGASNSDGITSNNQPSFSGTCVAGSTVRLFANGVQVGFQMVSGSTYNLQASQLPDGIYTMSATANDSPQSPTASITIDTVAPSIANPGSQTYTITSTSGTVVVYTQATATDARDAAPTVTQSPSSGSSFLPGATAVSVTAIDLAGNQSTASFVLNLVDSAYIKRSADASYSFSGPAGSRTLTITSGQVILASDATPYDPNLSVSVSGNGTSLLVDSTQHLISLSVADASNATLTEHKSILLTSNAITLAARGLLDMNDNSVLLDYSGTSPKSTIQDMIRSARNAGTWNGYGVGSASARRNSAHNTTLGLLDATEYKSIYGQSATFDGQAIDSTALLIKYTYNGDTDFNGKVNADDYSRIDAGYQNQHNAGFAMDWFHGDLDYNGVVNADDYALIDAAYQTQVAGAIPPSYVPPPARGGAVQSSSSSGGTALSARH